MRHLMFFALALAASVAVSCAQGTSDDPGSHVDARTSGGGPDARQSGFPDASQSNPPDAFVQQPADANVPPTPDAGGGGGGSGTDGDICNGDGDCNTGLGYCCFDLGQPPGFCVLGDESIGLCLPSS